MRRCPTPQAGPGTSGRNWDPQQHGCVLGMGQCWGAPLLFVGKLVLGKEGQTSPAAALRGSAVSGQHEEELIIKPEW